MTSWGQPPRGGQPQQPVDPWGLSFSAAAPTTTYGQQPQQQQQWPSTTSSAAPQWPTSAPQYPAASSSAWNTQQQFSQQPAYGAGARPAQSSAWPAPSQQQAWPAAAPQTTMNTSGAWPTASSSQAWPNTTTTQQQQPWGQPQPQQAPQQAWGETSYTSTANNNSLLMMNTSTGSAAAWPSAATAGGSFQQQRQQQPIPNPFESSYPVSNTNTSFASASSFNNPFDVTNDDAGFFSKPTANMSSVQKQGSTLQPAAAKDVPPPSATTQRLLRVASMLFERGLIIKADKMFIQEMVLKGDKKAERALETAERDGNLKDLHTAILKERKRDDEGSDEDDSEDDRAQAAASSFKKRPSVARKNSDEDDDQTETLFKGTPVQGKVEAPHPAAGGYTGNVPPEMGIQKGQFVGTILMRISSKKMFRKWKQVFFALDMPRLVVFENRREWEMGAAPKFVIPLHECMWIAKPTLKKTYSLIDDGRRVYYSTLKENSPSIVGQAAMSGMERPTAFSPALESRVVAKFGSYYPDEISAFAHAIYSVVLVHQKEVKANLKSAGGGSGRSPRRQGSGTGYGN